MAADIGAKIGIDGEKSFRDSLAAINSQMKSLGSEMKAVVSAFAGMEDSEEAVAAKSDVLQRSIETSAQKMNTLQAQSERAKKRLAELANELNNAQQEFGKNSEQAVKAQNAYNRQVVAVNKLETQINNTRAEINKMEREMRDVGRAADEMGDELQQAGREASEAGDSFRDAFLGGAAAGAVQSMVSGISDLVESTAEYRKIMGTLNTSSQEAGYTAEQTAETYNQLYGILGDNQSAATAAANLQALGLSQKELTKLTDGAIGAWATYGDSIPIDGLAEAINETIKVGKVTGSFADVLNWAGTSEDEFNAKLETAGSQAERTNIILEELANQGLMDAAEGWRQNNDEIVAANEATANLEATTGRLGTMLSPIVTSLKEGLNKILSTVLDLVSEGNPLVSMIAGVSTALAMMGLATFITQGTMVVDMLAKMKTAFIALSAAMKANPILLVVSLLAGLATALVTAYQTNEEFRSKVDAAWQTLKMSVGAAIENVKAFVDGLKEKFQTFINWLGNIPEEMKKLGTNIIIGLWNGINEKAAWLKGKVTSMVDLVKGLFSGADGFDTHSPSKWAERVGGWVMEGLGVGIADNTSALANVQDATSAIKDALMGAAKDATVEATVQGSAESMEPTMREIISGMKEQEPLLQEYILLLKESLLALFETFLPQWHNTGYQMMAGVAEGILAGRSMVVNAVAAVIAAAVGAATSALAIHSPSRVFAELGEYSMAGYAQGIESSMKSVVRTMNQSMAMVTTGPRMAMSGAAAGGSVSHTYGDINIRIDKISSEREAKTLAREIEFLRRQQATGKGGGA